MSLPVSITIHTEEPYHMNNRNSGFITCVLTFDVPPFDSLRMGFCLHCKELLSYTGRLKHVKKLPPKQRIALLRLFCPDKIDMNKQQILAEVEIFYEKWSSKHQGRYPGSPPSARINPLSWRAELLEKDLTSWTGSSCRGSVHIWTISSRTQQRAKLFVTG